MVEKPFKRYKYQNPNIYVYRGTLSKLWKRLEESENLKLKTAKKWFSQGRILIFSPASNRLARNLSQKYKSYEARMEIVPHRFIENKDGHMVDTRDGKELIEHELEAYVLNVNDYLDEIENQIGHFPEFDHYRSLSDETDEILLTRDYSNWGLMFNSDTSGTTKDMMASDVLEAAVGLLSLHEHHWPPAYHVVDSNDFHSFIESATILTAAGFRKVSEIDASLPLLSAKHFTNQKVGIDFETSSRLPKNIISATSPKLTEDEVKNIQFEELLGAVNGQSDGLRWYMLRLVFISRF